MSSRKQRRRQERQKPKRGSSRGIPWLFIAVLAALTALVILARTFL